MSLLSTSAIKLVKLDLRPKSFMKGGYGVSRSKVIGALAALDPLPIEKVTGELHDVTVKLSVFDDAVLHDSSWWSDALSSSQSRRWGTCMVDVHQWGRPTTYSKLLATPTRVHCTYYQCNDNLKMSTVATT